MVSSPLTLIFRHANLRTDKSDSRPIDDAKIKASHQLEVLQEAKLDIKTFQNKTFWRVFHRLKMVKRTQ
jgi:hypothetical protein